LQRALISILTVLFLLGLTTCSTGPGKGLDFDGSYLGSLHGVPAGTISLEISGSNVTGTISITLTSRWRGGGEAPHSTFTGTLSGREVTITAQVALETDIGIPPEVDWQEANTTLALSASFNDSGYLIGNYVGTNPINPDNQLNGHWSAGKTSGTASGITKPF